MDILEENDDLNRLYYLYGIASHNCSNIEYGIAYLLLGPKWAEIENIDPEKITKAYDELYKKPLGALLKTYKQHYKFSKKTLDQMNLVLEKRNYLIHRFFGNYGKKMHDANVVKEMIEELEGMIDIFQAASHSLDPEKME